MMTQPISDVAAALRAAIEVALPFESPAMRAKREAFVREAEELIPFHAWCLANRQLPQVHRAQLDKAANALEVAEKALADMPGMPADAQGYGLLSWVVGHHLEDRGVTVTGQVFESHILHVDRLLREIRAAVLSARDRERGKRPESDSRDVEDFVRDLAYAYKRTTGRNPTATAADRRRAKAKRRDPFEAIARAYCKAVGLRGMSRKDFLAGLANYRINPHGVQFSIFRKT